MFVSSFFLSKSHPLTLGFAVGWRRELIYPLPP